MEFFGFGGQEQLSPWELSQGGRQRLALGALLVGAPGVLVLDKPTTGQDADHKRAFLGLLQPGPGVHRADRPDRHPRHQRLASRASRVILLGDGQVGWTEPAPRCSPRRTSWPGWGVLAPPLARLQVELVGAGAGDMLLTVEDVDNTAVAARGTAGRGEGGGPVRNGVPA